MTIQELHRHFLKHPQISTDTRKIESNAIFFCLKGENFDGNTFAKNALAKGASLVIADDPSYAKDDKIVLVEDVLSCLQELASFHRNYCKAKVIALTGSNGKTTTKELIYAVLSKKYNTIATKGNLNNHIGVPLTLLSIQQDTEIAIIEMGANHLKEIEFLAAIAQPDFGYITNFGKAHLEGFGGEAGVIKGKSELYEYLMSHNKHIFLNADDPIQSKKLAEYIKKFGYSQDDPKYYNIKLEAADPFVSLAVEDITITTKLIGTYNFTNCCAAVLIGKYFNVEKIDIKEALEEYVPTNNRSQLLVKSGHKIILDAYNANPSSMQVALENFNQMKASYKIVFLGDMFELGGVAEEEHQKIADLADNMNFNQAFLIGENFNNTKTTLKKFRTFNDLSQYLEKQQLPPADLLIKGSRGMALERILDIL
ncbi:UDP-N-acetylmuramoyl-tripeptide--D-alanyl-D-alanine ligase [Muriicola sp. Z0-33]|uniref:UDP-N-acetylmuramoyl-tripeptide--D-alanyl-D- alanine ligase n=1 Tax=Muriicola sp. Z0-33 TaxID=2816957 RepID=UPI002237CFDA|nr:UDP-N-acetylmuramoyl-tripeptide--D-alanyl-D-alanine ligase [Muriicola sp. Z0-33]MCW5516735.1 UDP-N-acetylmuramoyl-tripeptide--D-alanyl-D-alanine ligase [Muriicola sp. Z0-33]